MNNYGLALLGVLRALLCVFIVGCVIYVIVVLPHRPLHFSNYLNALYCIVLAIISFGAVEYILGEYTPPTTPNNQPQNQSQNSPPNPDYRKANVYMAGNRLMFKKRMYHATRTLANAKEIFTHNLWLNQCDLHPGIHFGDIEKISPYYGEYIVEVLITCPVDEICEYPDTSLRLVRMYDDHSGFHYFIPCGKTSSTQRIRPSIVKPLSILKK